MRTPLVAGNWKMNGDSATNQALLGGLAAGAPSNTEVEWLVCPPFPYISLAVDVLKGANVQVGAQDLSNQVKGAYTGEIAANMLKDIGCSYVLIGHSERRQYHAESPILTAEKVQRAVEAGVKPILCVGESAEQKEAGQTEAVIADQLSAILQLENIAEILETLVIAYEPVWAIGTGNTADPADAQQIHAFIRAEVAKVDQNAANTVRILYGGSVKAHNTAAFMAETDIDGVLVGGASLDAEQFLQIGQACKSSS